MKKLFIGVFVFFLIACGEEKPQAITLTSYQAEHVIDIKTGNTTPGQLISFACSLSGTPYKYGSTDPDEGFDCSGFITYVFNHFNIMVPRTSVDFTPVQREIPIAQAKPGDLILFTGTNITDRTVGHMGIICSIPPEPLRFIHSSSGKRSGVVESDVHSAHYEARYVKTIRVFPQNDH